MKAIVFYLPEWMMNAPILKRASATNGCSVMVDEIEVTQSMLDAMLNPCPVFYKDGTEVKCFWPHQYACIETFGNHYVRLHPIDPHKGTVEFVNKSFDALLERIRGQGFGTFVRVNKSFAVNMRCFKCLKGNKVSVWGMTATISLSPTYRREFLQMIRPANK